MDNENCYNCRGTGYNHASVCDVCDGTGILAERAASNPASPTLHDRKTVRMYANHALENLADAAHECGKDRAWIDRNMAEVRAAFSTEAGIPASPAPVAAIRTWRDRFKAQFPLAKLEAVTGDLRIVLMEAEIADLRAALSSAPMAQAELGITYEADDGTIAARRDGELIWHAHVYPNDDDTDDVETAKLVASILNNAPATPAVPAAPSERDAGKCKTCGGERWVRNQHDMEQGLIRCTKCPAAPAAPIERENGQ